MLPPKVRPAGPASFRRSPYALLNRSVQRTFRRIDRATRQFQEQSGLTCEPGCGRCCLNPKVEATVLEMLPLAQHLMATNQDSVWYETFVREGLAGPCAFYRPDPLVPGKGRCQVYEHRPALCRLYGFSAMVHKTGTYRLVTCAVIKKQSGLAIQAIQSRIDQGLVVPLMTTFSNQLYQIDPILGCQRFPINEAFFRALDMTGLSARLGQDERPAAKKPTEKGGIDMTAQQSKQKDAKKPAASQKPAAKQQAKSGTKGKDSCKCC